MVNSKTSLEIYVPGIIYLCVNYSPPLRQYLMDGDFFVGAALATSLTKLALKYVTLTPDQKKQNVSNSPL